MAHNYALRGDISDALYYMAYYSYFGGFTGFLPTNIGIPSQFGTTPTSPTWAVPTITGCW